MKNLAFKQLELETLLEITNTLIEHENVNDLLQDILIRTCGILDASSGFVLIEEKILIYLSQRRYLILMRNYCKG